MAEDVATVRARARIGDVVGERVALQPDGVDSLKGLCPFHEEKTPSFHVQPTLGLFYCFGCQAGGDVVTFVQRIDRLSFVEAIEYLAAWIGFTLRYEQGAAGNLQPQPSLHTTAPAAAARQRVVCAVERPTRRLDACAAAAGLYADQLMKTAEGASAREFLHDRGFGQAAARRWGCGYALESWDSLCRQLHALGFTDAELVGAGLAVARKNGRGVYDRIRGRLTWPIRDAAGTVIGFGARLLSDGGDGNDPRYVNPPESPLYRKREVLFGLDLAQEAITAEKRVVVVEGYTDVMAMHAAGVNTTVAVCGTAFGAAHAAILRDLVGAGGEAVLCFDGDAAGQAAGERAKLRADAAGLESSVAVLPDGLDPAEAWLQLGSETLRLLTGTA